MNSLISLLALVLVAQANAPSAAPADDPIGALVSAAQAADDAKAEAKSKPSPPAAAAAAADDDEDGSPALPSGPQPYRSLPPSAGSIRQIRPQALVRLPPKPQGPLDGGWLLSQDRDGAQLYQFQFNDVGGGSEVAGAWRDMRRSGSLGASGTVSSVGYEGEGVTIRFVEPDRPETATVTLKPAPGGGWSGQLAARGQQMTVTMRRY